MTKKNPVTPVTPVGLGTFHLLNQTGAVENSTVLTFQIPTWLGTVKLGGCWEIRYFSEFPFIEGLKFPCGFLEGGFLQFRMIMAHLVSGLEVGGVMGMEWLQREEPRKNFHSEITGSTYDYNCILWCGVYYHLRPKQCNTNDHRNSGWISSAFQQTVDHSFRSEEFSQKAPELGMKFKFLQI